MNSGWAMPRLPGQGIELGPSDSQLDVLTTSGWCLTINNAALTNVKGLLLHAKWLRLMELIIVNE